MPPKPKKGGKKKDNADDPGYLAMRAFKKAYDVANQQHETEALSLNLEPGEGHSCIAKLILTPQTVGVNTHCPLAPAHAKPLCIALSNYPFMRRLCFWGVDLKDEGAQPVAAYVQLHRKLRVLELTDCNLGPAACKYLGEALGDHNPGQELIMLRLDHNRSIGNAGVAALIPRTGGSLCVKDLGLSFCGIEGVAGGTALAEGLMRKPMLTHLRIRGNALGTEGVIQVLNGVKTSTSLFHLDLSDSSTSIETELMKHLLETLELCTWLHEYYLIGNPMGDSVAYTLLRSMRHLAHVIQFEVSDGIDPLLYKQIGDMMTAHRKEWVKKNKKKKKGKKGKAKGKAKK
ncbi:hypothetical protein AB1Y20_009753 [Prymnesium parvum]|uniref:Uncharacterized protein n=1 Tax=Prymnesium parvum TaxID=97485 RepID=A0AB34K197_PRYPA